MISKKTALVGVFLVAVVLALVKFVWKPVITDDKVSPVVSKETAEPKPLPIAAPPALPGESMMNDETKAGAMMTSEKVVGVRTTYKNPGGGDEVGFILTVDGSGVITNATVDVLAQNPTARMRQEAFAAAFPQALRGKKLSELLATERVGGSSLTTEAFNTSLAELKAKL